MKEVRNDTACVLSRLPRGVERIIAMYLITPRWEVKRYLTIDKVMERGEAGGVPAYVNALGDRLYYSRID